MRVPSLAVASFLGILAGIGLALAPGGAAGSTLVGAALTQTAGEAVLTLSGDGPIRYDVFQLSEPDRVVIDLLDTGTAVEPTVSGRGCHGLVPDGAARCLAGRTRWPGGALRAGDEPALRAGESPPTATRSGCVCSPSKSSRTARTRHLAVRSRQHRQRPRSRCRPWARSRRMPRPPRPRNPWRPSGPRP